MGRGKNTIKLSDISTDPILIQYSASYTSQSIFDERYGITSNRGINEEILTRGTPSERALNYKVIKQLYYQNYLTGSAFSQTASYWDSNLQSTAASGTFDDDYRYFPTASNADISFLAIPTLQFGEQIRKKSFLINSTNGLFKLIDDGNGNIIDALNSNKHVGNILYAQGIVTLTDPDYPCAILDNTFNVSVSIVPTPAPSATPSITPSISISPTPTVSIGASVSITPSISKTPSITPTISQTPTISITPSISLTPSLTRTPSVSLTPTISISPSVSKTPSLTPSQSEPSTNLSVNAKFINTEGTIQYRINGGSYISFALVDSTSCINWGTINNLTAGDTVYFSEINSKVIAGSNTVCPTTGFSCEYSVSISAGPNTVYLTINGSIGC